MKTIKQINTLLSNAARDGRLKNIESALLQGADINYQNKEGYSPLMQALRNDHHKIADFLLEIGADVKVKSKDEETPLTLAAKTAPFDTVKIILDKGADMNNRALIEASGWRRLDIVELLLQRGANTEIRNRLDETALILVSGQNDSTIIAEYLLKMGANIEATDFYKETPLLRAIKWNQIDMVKLLIEKGADVDARSAYGENAFEFAKKRNRYEISAMLPFLVEKRNLMQTVDQNVIGQHTNPLNI